MLREARPRYTIKLGDSVARSILAEVALVAPERLETAGMLFAWECARTLDNHVVWASGAGNGSRHGPRSLLFATEKETRAAFPDWCHGEDLKRVGDWHYHPVAGASWPSRADMNVWAGYLSRADALCVAVLPVDHRHARLGRPRPRVPWMDDTRTARPIRLPASLA